MRLRNLITPLLACVMLGACAYPESDIDLEQYDYRARYPIGVETDVIVVSFGGGIAGAMTDEERQALSLMVADYKQRGQAPLTVIAGADGINQEAFAEEIRSSAVANGLAKSEVLVGVDPSLRPNEIQVSFVSYTAIVPECGYWYEESYVNFENANSANFGCATQHNLGVMLADPSDLIEPTPFDARDGVRTAIVVDLYRAGDATGAEHNETTTSIVDVGD
jgi:pilus biogenesis lipoprotein CpaD